MRKQQYIKTLDGWRAFAIIAVILSHLKDSLYPPGSTLFNFFSYGPEGVSLFFAISGYIISVKLFSEFDETSSINLRAFYIRRFFRLMPASLLYIASLILFNNLDLIQVMPIEIWSTVFFWRNYVTMEATPLTAHFWSLSVEEHFYLFFPSFLLLLKTHKKIFGGIVLLGLWVTFWRKIGTIDSITGQLPFVKYTMHYTMGRLDGLLYGALIAYIQRYYKNFSHLLTSIPPLLPLILIILLFIVPIPLAPTWKALLFPILIFSTMTNENSLISRFLELKPMTFIGKISYSLYIWHPLFVYSNTFSNKWMQAITGGYISLIPVLLISYLSYSFVETPMRNLGVRLSKAK